jgi:hypothetical protein
MKRTRVPARVWEATAVLDSLLVLGVGATRLPYPPNDVTNITSTAIVVLAFGTALVYWLST